MWTKHVLFTINTLGKEDAISGYFTRKFAPTKLHEVCKDFYM